MLKLKINGRKKIIIDQHYKDIKNKNVVEFIGSFESNFNDNDHLPDEVKEIIAKEKRFVVKHLDFYENGADDYKGRFWYSQLVSLRNEELITHNVGLDCFIKIADDEKEL